MPQATLNFEYVDKRTINALYENCLCFTALDDNCNIGFSIHNTAEDEANPNTFNISYSVDNGYTWNSITASGSGTVVNIATINAGKNLLIRGTNETLEGFRFTSGAGKTFNLSGNIISLLDDGIDNIDELPNYCFSGVNIYGIFANTGVIDASRLHLPDFTSTGCYAGMFSNSSLVKAPVLPATDLSQNCYVYMFRNTHIKAAPALPALSIPVGAYGGMFYDCAELTEAPALPATTLSRECYMQMFYRCTSLVTAPGLPAIYLAPNCYNAMFRGCTSLVSPPELPAQLIYQQNASGNPHEYLSPSCYRYMFAGCTSLTYAPYLPSKIIPQTGYANMFDGCTNLSYIHIAAEPMATTSTYTGRLTNWVRNVAPTGIFVKASANSEYLIDSNNGVPIGWTVYNDGDDIPDYVILTVQANDDSYGAVTGSGSYMYGTNATFQAYPNNGYNFSYWEIDGTNIGNTNPMTMQMTEDTTVTAVFVEAIAPPQKYTVTLEISPSGTQGFRLVGAGEYDVNSQVNIACYNDSNPLKEFDKWYLWDGSDYILASEEDFFTITLTEDVHYVAFTKDIPKVYYYIYAGLDPRSAGMGSTTGTGDYVKNSTATLHAIPNTGYSFIHWIKDGDEILMNNPLTITVDQSHQYLAYIRPTVPRYNLTIENNAMWASDIKVVIDNITNYGMDKDDYDGYTHDPKQWLYPNIDQGSTVRIEAEKLNDYVDFDGWWSKDENGKLILLSHEEKYTFTMQDELYIFCKWKIHEEEDNTDYSQEYFTITALQDDTDIYADIIRSPQNYTGPSYTLQTSISDNNGINFGEWTNHIVTRLDGTDYSNDRLICTLSQGQKVHLRAVMPWDWTSNTMHFIVCGVNIKPSKYARISGNLLSLVAGEGFLNSNTLSSNYIAFPFTFRYHIFDARKIWFPLVGDVTQNIHWQDKDTYYSNYYWTARSIDYGRFTGMFDSVYNSYMLAGPESLGSTVDYNAYAYLLNNCYNVQNMPECPATTLAQGCYEWMMGHCYALDRGAVLPATTCAEGCYAYMYCFCYNLQDPGSIYATTLANECMHSMYKSCRSLQTGPVLIAETMVDGCYNEMYSSCVSLSYAEVDLKYKAPAGQWGMYYMFGGGDQTFPDGRMFKVAGVEWMTREYLNSELTHFPDNWTLEDIGLI